MDQCAQWGQTTAAWPQLAAAIIQQPVAERLGQPRTAVVGRAAADSDDQPAHPRFIAASKSSPVPRVVATRGFRRSGDTSTNPEAVAISMTAVVPSPRRP